MGVIRKKKNKTTDVGKIGTLAHCWRKYKIVELLWRTIWSFLKKKKIIIGLWSDLAVAFEGFIQKN